MKACCSDEDYTEWKQALPSQRVQALLGLTVTPEVMRLQPSSDADVLGLRAQLAARALVVVTMGHYLGALPWGLSRSRLEPVSPFDERGVTAMRNAVQSADASPLQKRRMAIRAAHALVNCDLDWATVELLQPGRLLQGGLREAVDDRWVACALQCRITPGRQYRESMRLVDHVDDLTELEVMTQSRTVSWLWDYLAACVTPLSPTLTRCTAMYLLTHGHTQRTLTHTHLPSHALTCPHPPSATLTHPHPPSPTLTYTHRHSPTLTYTRLPLFPIARQAITLQELGAQPRAIPPLNLDLGANKRRKLLHGGATRRARAAHGAAPPGAAAIAHQRDRPVVRL